jgi:hypothetical protein
MMDFKNGHFLAKNMEVRELKRTRVCGGNFGGISIIITRNSRYISTLYFLNVNLLDRTT